MCIKICEIKSLDQKKKRENAEWKNSIFLLASSKRESYLLACCLNFIQSWESQGIRISIFATRFLATNPYINLFLNIMSVPFSLTRNISLCFLYIPSSYHVNAKCKQCMMRKSVENTWKMIQLTYTHTAHTRAVCL